MSLPTPPQSFQHWINGTSTRGSSGRMIERLSPGHDELVSSYPEGTVEDADKAVSAARKAFDQGPWRKRSGAERAQVLLKTATLIRANATELALLETLETGKPISQARGEMEWAAGIWDYAAGLARQIHGESYNSLGEQVLGLTLREPVGVVALITPWNFPLILGTQKLSFALGAGCTCVVKPSEMTSGTTLRLAQLLKEAGLPDGVCNVVTGFGNPVGQRLAEHPDVDGISFTGSTAVGKGIITGAAGNLKRVSLELGGKNPQIVFPDADLDAAVDAIVFGVYFNAGECCCSGSRILLHRDIPNDFVDRIVEKTRRLKVGDPLDEDTKVGPIINAKQFDKICSYLQSAPKQGAKLLTGGSALKTPRGRYIEATVFDRVNPDMSIACEEIFGPVLSILRFKDNEEAIKMANDTMYGLSASVWTRDFDRAVTFAQRIHAGTMWVNCFLDTFSELPFGGYKQSGWGRELGRNASDHFTEVKTLICHLGPRTAWWAQ